MRLQGRVAGLLAGVSLALTLAGAAEAPSRTGVGDDAWAAVMQARRASLQSSQNVRETSWYEANPMKAASMSEAFPPEKGVDLDESSSRRRAWQPKPYPNGVVNQIKTKPQTTTYLYRTLVATAAEPIQLRLGSSGGLALWVNGEKLLSKDVTRTAAPDQETVKATLRAGTNTLLLKLHTATGNLAFYYNTDHSVAGALAPVAKEYPDETKLLAKHATTEGWLANPDKTAIEEAAIERLLQRLHATAERQQFDVLKKESASPQDLRWLKLLLTLARQADAFQQAKEELEKLDLAALDLAALGRAIQDLSASYPGKYRDGPAMLQQLKAFEKDAPALAKGLENCDKDAMARYLALVALRQKALLSNPLLDFEQMLVVKRRENELALPQNWQGNSSLNPRVENELCLLPVRTPGAPLKTFYQPAQTYYVGDVDLNYDADKLLFSSIGSHNRWQVFEIHMDGTGLRQVTPGDEPDVDNYDAVYLPDNRIIFDSTSTFQGVPCVGGADYVANLHLMNPDGTHIRRLCFDQDNDWYPVVMASGRVMYLRWEYTDSAHYFSRVLMSMNPDGTSQAAVYHSNSYWPNGMFYARPLPGSPTKFVAILSGHHGVPRMGELALFDMAKGRQEDTGALQRIPGFGKPVQGIIKDQLVNDSWPKFLHPYPLNDRYFVVSCKPTPGSAWGIYLVDVFDNMLLLKEEPGFALFEPLPVRKTERPPVIQDKVKLSETNATVYMHDVYVGAGLRGVQRGIVKSLRVFQYEYSYRNQGGHYFVGMEGPWDLRRMIGTVPVEADGSAMFHIPANTPVSLQPLDEEGKALQQMRSWLVGMPGEYVSCAGCHESQNSTAAPTLGLAARKPAVEPTPWRGPKRGFSFVREVQPVLDRYCVGCHNGEPGRPNLSDPKLISTSAARIPRSYAELHPYLRRNGPEGDYHTLTPLEFHANTSLLVQMLRKGHHNVQLDAEAWDRLITWIDLNVPAHGTYHEVASIPQNFEQRRYESKKKYANVDEDIEAIPTVESKPVAFLKPEPLPPPPAPVKLPGWPIESAKAKQLQRDLGTTEMSLDLGGGAVIQLKKIPAGEFVMGDVEAYGNEYPTAAVRIDKAFWIGATEVSLAQYQQFDPSHCNGYYDMHYKDQVKPGYLMDFPDLPVIRVSWDQAMAFCQWLSARSGKKVLLPTEAQWEWTCRAGSGTPMFYGGLDTDFSAFANLADASLSKLAVQGVNPQPIRNPDKFWDYVPKEARFNDGTVHLAPVEQHQPNAWGLHNMIGNVAEWTLDDYRPYPYQAPATCAGVGAGVRKAVRGGSWSERPKESRASARWDYPQWQRVYNVGLRIVVVE
jgi:formylglycine-generating enzyme required for sulfatase activity